MYRIYAELGDISLNDIKSHDYSAVCRNQTTTIDRQLELQPRAYVVSNSELSVPSMRSMQSKSTMRSMQSMQSKQSVQSVPSMPSVCDNELAFPDTEVCLYFTLVILSMFLICAFYYTTR